MADTAIALAATTACFYEDRRPIWMLDNSARHFGIELHAFGVGERNNHWIDIKIVRMIREARRLEQHGYSHMLYTDGRDSFFTQPLAKILKRYTDLGAPPMLMAAEQFSWPASPSTVDRVFARPQVGYRYPCAGQFIANIEWLVENYQMLYDAYHGVLDNNDQAWIQMGKIDGLLNDLVLDNTAAIFQSMSGYASDHVAVTPHNPMFYNHLTGSHPAVVHYNGGYTDPVTGKAEKMLGIYRQMQLPEEVAA